MSLLSPRLAASRVALAHAPRRTSWTARGTATSALPLSHPASFSTIATAAAAAAASASTTTTTTTNSSSNDVRHRGRTRLDHFVVVSQLNEHDGDDAVVAPTHGVEPSPASSSSVRPPPRTLQERIASALKKLRPRLLQDEYDLDSRHNSTSSSPTTTLLGEGRFGKIRAATQIATGLGVAVKTIPRFYCKRDRETGVPFEVLALRSLNPANPLSLRYLDHYETPLYVHVVTERLRGPSLFEYSEAALNWEPVRTRAREAEIKDLVLRLARGVMNVHRAGWVHLDVKFDNFVWRRPGEESVAAPVLIDYGFARPLPPHGTTGKLHETHGSPSYAAPEVVFRHEFDARADAWSLGVVAFGLLRGYLPFCFDDVARPDDYRSLCCVPAEWSACSKDALDFVKRLLTVDVERRLTVAEALEHPWLTNHAGVLDNSSCSSRPPRREESSSSV